MPLLSEISFKKNKNINAYGDLDYDTEKGIFRKATVQATPLRELEPIPAKMFDSKVFKTNSKKSNKKEQECCVNITMSGLSFDGTEVGGTMDRADTLCFN